MTVRVEQLGGEEDDGRVPLSGSPGYSAEPTPFDRGPAGEYPIAQALTYGSVCSGIEAASVAWAPLGWQAAFVSEIDPAPRAVLAHRYPEVPLHGDFTTIQAGTYGPVQLLVGGTPCQSFSVTGLRGGLADDRGNLALQFLRLADRLRPRWLVWENVPGVLSSNGGRDFGAILGGMVELGYGFAYRVLDAQYVRVDGYGRAVPQRRRRVFVVGHLGDWRRPAAVLLERACLRGDPAPRREAGAGVAIGALAGTGPGGGWRVGPDEAAGGQLVPVGLYDDPRRFTDLHGGGDHGSVHPTLESTNPKQIIALDYTNGLLGEVSGTLEAAQSKGNRGHGVLAFDTTQITNRENRSNPRPGDPCHTLTRFGEPPAIAFNGNESFAGTGGVSVEHTPTLKHGAGGGSTVMAIAQGWSVRRLTPTECERLQGFLNGWTAVPWRGGIMPDGPRYKMLGNSMAVNCMRWIGQRIALVEADALAIKARQGQDFRLGAQRESAATTVATPVNPHSIAAE